MIMNFLKASLFSITLLVSNMCFSASLEHNMETLAKNFKAFNQSKNEKDALQALDNMRADAIDSKKVKLKAPTAQTLTSDVLYDQIIVQIDKTKSVVKADGLEQAKVEAKKIATIRDQGHQIYRN